MREIFNSSLEVSLRILLILNIAQSRLSIDRIVALDFITTYGKDFGVSEDNLHGDNDYRFGEYTIKRKKISEAIKDLVLRGYVIPHCNKGGFKYSISTNGTMLCENLSDKYAEDFSDILKKAKLLFVEFSDRKLTQCINEYAIVMLGRKKL